MAVDLVVKHIDTLARQYNAKLTYYRDGDKIPLHYEGFSCSNEQKFADGVAGDRR